MIDTPESRFNWRQFLTFLATWTIPNSLAWFLAWWIVRYGFPIINTHNGTILYAWLVVGFIILIHQLFFRWYSLSYSTGEFPLPIPKRLSRISSTFGFAAIIPGAMVSVLSLEFDVDWNPNLSVFIFLMWLPFEYAGIKCLGNQNPIKGIPKNRKRSSGTATAVVFVLGFIFLFKTAEFISNTFQVDETNFLSIITLAGVFSVFLEGIVLSYLLVGIILYEEAEIIEEIKYLPYLWFSKVILILAILFGFIFPLILSPIADLILFLIESSGG